MKTSDHLVRGEVYSRKELQAQFGIVDATIRTGVFHPKGHDSVWLFITEKKTPDRTQYRDILRGDTLEMDGQTAGRTDGLIINHKINGLELVLFYRKTKRQFANYGFVYEGVFEYVTHSGNRPTHFTLRRVNSTIDTVEGDLESLREEEEFFEGTRRTRYTNYYERNSRLRAAAIDIHGMTCQVCGFNFESTYGERGQGYIEVHHLVPVSDLNEATAIDPATDMAVVCANCHRMIHRRRDEVLSIDEVRALLHRST